MINKLKPALKIIYKIWKPDFRKTTGTLFITSGILLLSPSYIQEIIFDLLKIHGIFAQESYANAKVIGSLMISCGVCYHLLYVASVNNNKALETLYSLYLLLLLPLMIYLSI